jgi:predicted ATP-grasp superfamily ATP-dependent carboligase
MHGFSLIEAPDPGTGVNVVMCCEDQQCGILPQAESLPYAVVLTCSGAGDGALGVVQTLGRAGIRIVVVSDQSDTTAALSRYCSRFIHLPDFTQNEASTLDHLVSLAQELGPLPVLFPTSDPDLLLVAHLETELRRHYRLVASSSRLLMAFTDKRRFDTLAREHCWTTPRTIVFHPGTDVRHWSHSLDYPVIIKPATPEAWTGHGVPEATSWEKALRVETEAELLRVCEQLSALGAESIVQEYVPGPDQMHVDLHAYRDPEFGVMGCFTGRKIRIHPPGAGSGCYVESVYVQEVVDLGLQVLQDVDYHGLANINFKVDARSGKYVLFEVNPRVSAWNILAAECGVALPLLAYARSAGLECRPMGRQREGVRYVNLRNDIKTYLKRRKTESYPVGRYLRSLLYRPLIHQTFSLHDPKPVLSEARRSFLAIGRSIAGVLERQVSRVVLRLSPAGQRQPNPCSDGARRRPRPGSCGGSRETARVHTPHDPTAMDNQKASEEGVEPGARV